jgi:succinate dehydrogenase/fumarate reductase-like Fe-S protein
MIVYAKSRWKVACLPRDLQVSWLPLIKCLSNTSNHATRQQYWIIGTKPTLFSTRKAEYIGLCMVCAVCALKDKSLEEGGDYVRGPGISSIVGPDTMLLHVNL